MRRSTEPSLLSAVASPATSIRRLGRRLTWLMLAIGLALGVSAGAAGPAQAQGDGFEMHTYVANCEIVPPLPPTLDEAGCAPATGAYVEFTAEDGSVLGGCTASAVTPNGLSATCTVLLPYNTRGQATLDMSTIAPGYAPRQNPIFFTSPGPGPVDGIVGHPFFVNVATGGGGDQSEQPDQTNQPEQTDQTEQSDQSGDSGQTDQSQPDPQPEQAAPADRYAFIITGTCADPGETLDGRIDVYAPTGDPLGLPTALIAESGGGSFDVALDDLFASPHAVFVVTPSDGQGTDVACGDLGTVADDDGVAVIGLRPAAGSEMGGIAYLATDESTGETMVSIFLSEGLG
jgi:hypothetical protein